MGPLSHNILFWNARKNNLAQAICDICQARNVDTIVIAEAWPSVSTLGQQLSAPGVGGFLDVTGRSDKLHIFSRLPFASIVAKADGHGVAIRQVKPSLGSPFLLVAVHLPSKLYYRDNDQTIHARTIVDLIRSVEADVGHTRTLVIGDFNMDPFEPGMAAAGAFHAVMDRHVARRQRRRINGSDYPFFYNPMWSRMGDSSGRPPGTFKRSGSTYLEYFWRTFDQVLLGPDLLDRVPDSAIEVVNCIGSRTFVDSSGRWHTPSDHLPILVSVG